MLRSFVQPFDIFNCTCIWLDDERWMNGTLYVLNLDAWSLVRSVLLIFFSFLCCIFCFVCLCGLRTQCCQFLWIVDSWLPLQFLWIVDSWLPLQFLWIVDSWLPCPFSFSGLWILDCLAPSVSLDCGFLIAPSVSLDCGFLIAPSVSLDCGFLIAPSVFL
jgi:hypothetical protein